jgi:isopentenyl-diphosphate delta-isomerase
MSTTTTTATQTITADNVVTLFPDVDTSLARSLLPSVTSSGGRTTNESVHEGGELEGYDEEQIRLMDEVCIVLDYNDNPIGSASKKTCMVLLFHTTQESEPFKKRKAC